MARSKSAQLWDRHSFLRRADGLPPVARDVLGRLIDFAENAGAIEWGLKSERPLFNFRCPTPSGKTVSAFYVEISPEAKNPYANAHMEFDFLKLNERKLIAPDIIERYREDLNATGTVPEEARAAEYWKFFRVERLRDPDAFEKFKQAVLNFKEASASA